MDLDQFLPMLSAVDQEKHISTIPLLDRNHPGFYWIFRNVDYAQWNDSCFQVLWLSGPPECNIHQVSSYVVGQEKDTALKTGCLVLYFFCSATTRRRSIAKDFVHTLLGQILYCSQVDERTSIIRGFLRSLLDEFSKMGAVRNWIERGFKEENSSQENIQKLLNGPVNELLTALGTVLSDEERRSLVVVDELDKIEHDRGEFVKEVHAFVKHIRGKNRKAKILLTSRPLDEIRDTFDGLPRIEHDRERKGSLTSHFLILN